jgi:hypothetical protein
MCPWAMVPATIQAFSRKSPASLELCNCRSSMRMLNMLRALVEEQWLPQRGITDTKMVGHIMHTVR